MSIEFALSWKVKKCRKWVRVCVCVCEREIWLQMNKYYLWDTLNFFFSYSLFTERSFNVENTSLLLLLWRNLKPIWYRIAKVNSTLNRSIYSGVFVCDMKWNGMDIYDIVACTRLKWLTAFNQVDRLFIVVVVVFYFDLNPPKRYHFRILIAWLFRRNYREEEKSSFRFAFVPLPLSFI